MKNFNFRVGIDVSKSTLDLYSAEFNEHLKIANNTSGFKQMIKWLKELKIPLKDVLFALEYTGGYEYKLLQFCETKNIAYARLSGLAIKKSMGIVRGKNDKIDAFRIAQYADEKRKSLQVSRPINNTILNLKQLLNLRKKMVRENAGYKATIKGRKDMFEAKESDFHIKILNEKMQRNKTMIETIEEEIKQVILSDQKITQNFCLLCSIKGIGLVNAAMTIAFTENFEAFQNARSYAVYVGVVPFEHSSGSSINGRKKVSQLANKELKQELNQAAKSAIMWNGEIKEYAERLKGKKHYGIILNNIKFKLITRMFAVVKRGEIFVDNYKISA